MSTIRLSVEKEITITIFIHWSGPQPAPSSSFNNFSPKPFCYRQHTNLSGFPDTPSLDFIDRLTFSGRTNFNPRLFCVLPAGFTAHTFISGVSVPRVRSHPSRKVVDRLHRVGAAPD